MWTRVSETVFLKEAQAIYATKRVEKITANTIQVTPDLALYMCHVCKLTCEYCHCLHRFYRFRNPPGLSYKYIFALTATCPYPVIDRLTAQCWRELELMNLCVSYPG